MALQLTQRVSSASIKGAHGIRAAQKPVTGLRRHYQLRARAFGDSGNCITEATSRSIIAGAVPDGSGGGSSPGGAQGGGGSSGGGGGSEGGGSGQGGQGPEGGKPHPMQPWTYVYALLLAVGGIMGFVKKGSNKSLGGGLSAALVLALAARAMQAPGSQAAGAQVALAISLLMGVFFIARYTKSKKIMPGGVGAGLSLGMAVGYVACGF